MSLNGFLKIKTFGSGSPNNPIGEPRPFYILQNGVTVRLKGGYPPGTTGKADNDFSGKIYTAVSQSELEQLDKLTTDFSLICTTLCTDFNSLFIDLVDFNQDISSWDTSNVIFMRNTFSGDGGNPTTFNQDIGNWDVSKVRNFSGFMQFNYSFNQDLGKWRPSSCTTFSFMFDNARAFNNGGSPSINDWDVSSGIEFTQFLRFAQVFNQPLNNWDLSSAENTQRFFNEANSFNQPLDNWNVSNVTNMDNMFNTSSFNQDISNWCVQLIPSEPTGFSNNSPLNNLPNFKPNWGVACGEQPFFLDSNGVTIKLKDGFGVGAKGFADGDTSGKIYTAVSQSELEQLDKLTTDWSLICTTLCDNFSSLFSNISLNPEISHFDTSNVTDIRNLCRNNSLFQCDINSWDVSKVELFNNAFADGCQFNQPLDNWNTSSATTMTSMFRDNDFFNQDISSWDVSNVIAMNQMFKGASAFNQPIGLWDVSSVKGMNAMLQDAQSFNQPLNDWNVSSVERMDVMFATAYSFNQPLNNWDVSNVTNMTRMFDGFSGNRMEFNQDLSDWCVQQILTQPTGFDRGTPDWVLPRPNWGAACGPTNPPNKMTILTITN